MSISKIIGAILIVGSLALGYFGVNKVAENNSSIEILNLDIDVSNKSGKEQGYIYLGLAVVMLGGGVYLLKKSD